MRKNTKNLITIKHKDFWLYFLFGMLIGFVVGIMKNQIAVWFVVGTILGFLIALLIEIKLKDKVKPEKLLWLGFFLLFPIMFFADYLKGSFWYDFFGILAVIGSFTIIVNFVKFIIKKNLEEEKKSKKIKRKK